MNIYIEKDAQFDMNVFPQFIIFPQMNISNPKTIECLAKNLLIGRRKTG